MMAWSCGENVHIKLYIGALSEMRQAGGRAKQRQGARTRQRRANISYTLCVPAIGGRNIDRARVPRAARGCGVGARIYLLGGPFSSPSC